MKRLIFYCKLNKANKEASCVCIDQSWNRVCSKSLWLTSSHENNLLEHMKMSLKGRYNKSYKLWPCSVAVQKGQCLRCNSIKMLICVSQITKFWNITTGCDGKCSLQLKRLILELRHTNSASDARFKVSFGPKCDLNLLRCSPIQKNMLIFFSFFLALNLRLYVSAVRARQRRYFNRAIK